MAQAKLRGCFLMNSYELDVSIVRYVNVTRGYPQDLSNRNGSQLVQAPKWTFGGRSPVAGGRYAGPVIQHRGNHGDPPTKTCETLGILPEKKKYLCFVSQKNLD